MIVVSVLRIASVAIDICVHVFVPTLQCCSVGSSDRVGWCR